MNRQFVVAFIWHYIGRLPPVLDYKPISSEGLAAVVLDYHPLASRDAIDLAELRDDTFLVGDTPWLPDTQLTWDLFLKRGFAPKTGQVAYLRYEFFTFVLRGMGILTYPENVVCTKRTGLKAVPIRDGGRVVDVSMVWRNEIRNPAVCVLELRIFWLNKRPTDKRYLRQAISVGS